MNRITTPAYQTILALARLPLKTVLSLPLVLLGVKVSKSNHTTNQPAPKMSDNSEHEQSPEPQPKPKPKPRRHHRQEPSWDLLPTLNLQNLSTPQLTATRAIGVLVFYAVYLQSSSGGNVSKAPSDGFLPPITRGGDLDPDSETLSGKSVVELYLAVLVGVLYLWPFWKWYKGATFFGLVLSCASCWGVSLVIYLSFLKLIQHYGLS
ncbi:hypothetical protein F4680DRAFT_40289 [Xylaria scruposa]|nr:hypothetical protein F4680DRAFT_40289 [Xylaria scruposa]